MLTRQSLSSAFALVAQLDGRALAIVPQPNTPLGLVVQNAHTDDQVLKTYGEKFQLDLLVIETLTNQPNSLTGINDYGEYSDAVVDKLADAISGHLHYTRTVVVPAIEELVDRTRPLIEHVNRPNYSDLEVRVYKTPGPLTEPSILEALERHREVVPENLTLGAGLPEIGFEDILAQMKTGAPSSDESLQQFFLELGTDKTVQLYKDWFTMKGREMTSSQAFDGPQSTAYALMGWAIARKLWNNPPDNVDMSGSNYQNYMADVRNNCALQLLRELNRMDRDVANDMLVRNYGSDYVEVHDSVYRKWLGSGGSNEMLFGSILSTKPSFHGGTILEAGAEHTRAWNAYLAMNRTSEANRKFVEAKGIMRLEFCEILSRLSQDDCPMEKRETIRKLFEQALERTPQPEVQDLHLWACRLLCQSRFAHTDAYEILQGIARVKSAAPGIDTREAAAVATIEYIAQWLCAQTTVVEAAA